MLIPRPQRPEGGAAETMAERIVLAGGSGFIGQALGAYLAERGADVITLTRTPRPQPRAGRDLEWDGEHLGPWTAALDGAAAMVNLTGRNVDCRYTPEHRRE